MPVELDEDTEPCPLCTYPSKEYPHTFVTMGCKHCNFTGHKNLWKLVGQQLGGHYHCKLYVGNDSKALIGHIVLSEQNWKEFGRQMGGNPLWTIYEHIVSNVIN